MSEKYFRIVEFELDDDIDELRQCGVINGHAYVYADSYSDEFTMHHCMITVDGEKLWCSIGDDMSFIVDMVSKSIDGTEKKTRLFSSEEKGEFQDEQYYLHDRLVDYLVERMLDESRSIQLI